MSRVILRRAPLAGEGCNVESQELSPLRCAILSVGYYTSAYAIKQKSLNSTTTAILAHSFDVITAGHVSLATII